MQTVKCFWVFLFIIFIQLNGFMYSNSLLAHGFFHVNAHQTEYMCFNQTCGISTQNGSSLKLVDKFTYLGNSVSSTETDIDTQQAKGWTANDSLSNIRKSDLTDKMKRSFDTAIWMYNMDATETYGEKLDGN